MLSRLYGLRLGLHSTQDRALIAAMIQPPVGMDFIQVFRHLMRVNRPVASAA
jgi:hypothetical protein